MASRQIGILGGTVSRRQPVVVAIVTTTLVGFAIWRALRRDFLPVFFLGWFAIFLLPVLPLRNHVSDYSLTLPAIGLAMLMGYALTVAWRQRFAWKLAGVALAVCYLTIMLSVDRASSRWYYQRGRTAESILTGIMRARELHPGKAILLAGLTDELFELTISPNALGAMGVNDVYVTPESRTVLHSEPVLDDYYTLPAQSAREVLAHGSAVVYEVRDGELRDITARYFEQIRRKPGG